MHIDESYIMLAWGGDGKYVDHPLCPTPDSVKVRHLRHRNHATQLMVLIAIANPKLLNYNTAGEQGTGEVARFDPKQNGKVAIFPIVEKVARQRS